MSIKRAAVGLVRRHWGAIRFVVIFTCALLLIGAAALYYLNPASQGTLLTITPKAAERGVSVDELEEINDEKFMITYMCRESVVAGAVNTKQNAVVIATNYTYPYVMRYVMKSGGFFTSVHQEQKSRTAVLNEKAAFDLFGCVDTGNEITVNNVKYSVVGVVADGDEEFLNIYIPITLTDSRPNEFMVRLGDEVSEAYVKNELKQVGVSETNYDFLRETVIDRLITLIHRL